MDISVTRSDIAPGAAVVKYPSRTSAANWGFPVIHTLDDGRTVPLHDRGYARKKDALVAFATYPHNPPKYPTAVMFDDDGNAYGLSVKYGSILNLGR